MNTDTTTHPNSTRGAGSTAGSSGQPQSVGDAINRGTAGIARSAQNAGENLADDMSKLRTDIAAMQQTMAKFMAEASNEAAKSARSIGQTVASQITSATGDIVQAGSDVATQAKDQMKTFASELESTARKNPLGTLAATLVVGVVIGMMSRGRG